MKGNMQSWGPNVAQIIEHARVNSPKVEVVSRLISGDNCGRSCKYLRENSIK